VDQLNDAKLVAKTSFGFAAFARIKDWDSALFSEVGVSGCFLRICADDEDHDENELTRVIATSGWQFHLGEGRNYLMRSARR
jgi:hypothetical protein